MEVRLSYAGMTGAVVPVRRWRSRNAPACAREEAVIDFAPQAANRVCKTANRRLAFVGNQTCTGSRGVDSRVLGDDLHEN